MKKEKAEITVLLSLISLLVFSLIATTLEGARAACVNYLMEQAAGSAAESVFAAYDSDLLEDYGLLMRRGRSGEEEILSSEVGEYLRRYLEPTANTLLEGDRVGLRNLAVREDWAVYATEGGGRIFTDAVLAYMKTAGVGVLVKESLERLGILDENGLTGLGGTLENFLGSDDYSLDDILGDYGSLKDKASELISEMKERQASEALYEEVGDLIFEAAEDVLSEMEEECFEDPSEESGEGQLPGGADDAEDKELSAGLLEELKKIRDQGLLYVLTNGDISPNTWLGYYPSDLDAAEKYRHMNFAGSDFSFDEKLFLNEYMMNFFGCYTAPKAGGQRYEAEYVLTGCLTEKEALETVCGRLMLIRTGFNLAYLYTDNEKKAVAEAAALAITTALTLPELTRILKPILMAAWAAAEAVVDVRALLQGKRVPLWKSAGSWKLQALSMDSASSDEFRIGLGYRDYLRLLFLLRDGETAAYRMMDVIESRMRLTDPDFTLREYTVCASFTFTAVTPNLYLQYPLFRRLAGAGTGRKYTKTAMYGY